MKKVGIIGLGLIGGSIALSLKKKNSAVVYGLDTDAETAAEALHVGAVDELRDSLKELAASAELLIAAVPLSSIDAVFREIADCLRDDLTVTDVCSLKMPVVRAAENILPSTENFIGGHPMAGSEKGGFKSASHELFIGRTYILTPTEKTSERAIKDAHWLIKELGARPAVLSPEEHDAAVAYSSHLPHVLSWSFVGLMNRDPMLETAAKFGGPSFRDITRISMAPSDLWSQILIRNREKVAIMIEELMQELENFRKILISSDEKKLRFLIETMREKRMEISRAIEAGEVLYRVEVVLMNRPGELAAVTAALGREGINIENIEMVHGEGQGLLFIDIANYEASQKAADILRKKGYEVTVQSFESGLDD
jgi:prephenate dehydrogenase